MEKELEALRQIASLITDSVAQPPTDEILPTTGLQVLTEDSWMPATREVWRSWVGHRAVWGMPYHGPVYALGASDDAAPWTGPRTCSCLTCQAHVAPDSRLN